MIDNLFFNLKKAQKSKIFKNLRLITDSPNPFIRDYMLLTLHRPTNVDSKESLKEIIEALKEISKGFPIIFPMHPRTRKMVSEFNLEKYFNFHIIVPKVPIKLSNSIYAIDPLGYIDFLALMSKAKLVLTDSGGIQEETMVLGIPCLTLRDTTERPITVTEGTNILVHNDKKKIVEGARKILKEPKNLANRSIFLDKTIDSLNSRNQTNRRNLATCPVECGNHYMGNLFHWGQINQTDEIN
jgi:UDP-N-acetylglucosamine 2-epimerase (non-hydrolysing)